MTVLQQLSLVIAEAVDEFTILAAGGRYHDNPALIGDRLYRVIGQTESSTIRIRYGACPGGADKWIGLFCQTQAAYLNAEGRTLIADPWPADWDHCAEDCPPYPHRKIKHPDDIFHPGLLDDYCPKAGPRRNKAMAAALPKADVFLGFPHPRSFAGTASCQRYAKKAGISAEWVLYERPAVAS